ncbi:MAG: hypothetical protein OXT09_32180 [Myxococcales bacterium]|nr:hypothetical protein [Myxococcales bacterium]
MPASAEPDRTGRAGSDAGIAASDGGSGDADPADAQDAGGDPGSDAGTDGGGGASDVGPGDAGQTEPLRRRWSQNHGDLTFVHRADDGALDVTFRFDGATLDGDMVHGDVAVDGVVVHSTAGLTRPEQDNGFFAGLCVDPGQQVAWLPQRNSDAFELGVPFVGLLAGVDAGVFVDDVLTLELVGVRSPSGSGAYSLWRDGFPPTFFFASCDGIDAADAVQLPIGHDHFNMGFTEPGVWEVDYRISGELVEGGSSTGSTTVRFLLE